MEIHSHQHIASSWKRLYIYAASICLLTSVNPAQSANHPREKLEEQVAEKVSKESTAKTKSTELDSKPRQISSAGLILNPAFWPPQQNRFYPDFELLNQDGRKTRLSDYRGKIIIIQPIARDCSSSQAYAGANKTGMSVLGTCFPKPDQRSIHELSRDLAGVDLNREDIVFVQLLVSNGKGKDPTVDDAREWAEHFGMDSKKNRFVLIPSQDMLHKYRRNTRLMVPGFQLLDRAFVLRCDSTGPIPKNDLYNEFFPALGQMFY